MRLDVILVIWLLYLSVNENIKRLRVGVFKSSLSINLHRLVLGNATQPAYLLFLGMLHEPAYLLFLGSATWTCIFVISGKFYMNLHICCFWAMLHKSAYDPTEREVVLVSWKYDFFYLASWSRINAFKLRYRSFRMQLLIAKLETRVSVTLVPTDIPLL